MITGLNHITLAVKNIETSFAFYRDVLGFTPLCKWEGCSPHQYDYTQLKNYTLLLEDEFPLERPFVAYHKNQEQELCYIGADHSSDINSKTFKLIRTTIEEFKPDILVL